MPSSACCAAPRRSASPAAPTPGCTRAAKWRATTAIRRTRAVASPFERGRSLHWPYPFDRGALDDATAAVVGTHDFTAFTPTQTDHVLFRRNVLRAQWVDAKDALELWIEAESFMRHMVRTLVGTMLEVAGGRRTQEDLERLLRGAPRREAGDTAAAQGLYLESVRYR